MNPHSDSEKELLRRIRDGEANARYLVYKKYIRYLTAVCSKYITSDEDVKDVLQESMLRIFSSMDTFHHQGEGSLKAWMSRIVVNESLKWLKAHNRLQPEPLEESKMDIPDEEPDTGGVPTSEIHEMIRALPDGYRTVFNLYVLERKSHREIAGMLGIKESTSASQLHRAKALLKEMITQFQTREDTDR